MRWRHPGLAVEVCSPPPVGLGRGGALCAAEGLKGSAMTVRVGINGFGRIGRNFLPGSRTPRARTSRSWRSTT